ncbi:protein TolQ [Orientia tsutsugamushi str. Gilliam]|uniref:Protein TolQ n=1 Tax=Orientia tsutsugamushi str. Gilliam TaxID=1359184 RepID=A0A0F3M7D2_ORITS|nr:protein TolQ [Orientia tsutsugamushi]KJV51658.1 protein TolQ [Orientia tsutsugamushi str. Gilliam]SPR10446.1 protein TolQ [Orientia tsutsugamushi str. Gilliam]
MLEHSSLTSQISIISAFLSADIICKTVMVTLIIASIWSWTIIFYKYYHLNNIKKEINTFNKLLQSNQSVDELYGKINKNNGNSISSMLTIVLNEYKNEHNVTAGNNSNLKDRLLYTIELTKNQISEQLETYLIVLATISSTAPFIGLLGTVWGIMHSFQAIAATKNTSIAVVAPGIAEALLATAIGLFAAIPAGIFYNILTHKVSLIENKLENFIRKFYTVLCKTIDKK